MESAMIGWKGVSVNVLCMRVSNFAWKESVTKIMFAGCIELIWGLLPPNYHNLTATPKQIY